MKAIEVLNIGQFENAQTPADFYVNTISNHLRNSHAHIEKPHRHDFYALMLFTTGNGFHSIDFNNYEVKPGCVFAMSPGQIHHWQLSPETDGWIFFHTAEFYESRFCDGHLADYPFFNLFQNMDHLELGRPESVAIGELFGKMYAAELSDEKLKPRLLISILTQIYIELTVISRHRMPQIMANSPIYNSKFKIFEQLLEYNFKSEKSPDWYARRLNMTSKHLNRISKTILGKTTSSLILGRVMLEARRMLMYSDKNFNEIASDLGYDDYAYFSKLFRQRIGMAPSQFQAKHR